MIYFIKNKNMAIWHYNFYLKLNKKNNIVSILKIFKEAYKHENKTHNWIVFWDFDEDFIEIIYNDEWEIENISWGFNLLTTKKEFIEKIISICKIYNIQFLNIEEEIIECSSKEIKNNIINSQAYKYVNNPEDFLNNL